ncbi:MAG: hypothetical protein R2941_13180 [Desulfobacterales bacterium]
MCGGVRIVFDQARALILRGHRVSILSRLGDHEWYPYPVEVHYAPDFFQACAGIFPDIVVGTFWKTIKPAAELNRGLPVHLCQGCEWSIPEYKDIHADIENVYRLPIPKITVGEWLNEQIWERFGKGAFPVECVGQIADTDMFQPPSLMEKAKNFFRRCSFSRILTVGMFESQVSIGIALKAVARVREKGFPIYLARYISTVPLTENERQITH